MPAKRIPPPGDENFDTPKVKRGQVLLNFSQLESTYQKNDDGTITKTGGTKRVVGNSLLYYPQAVISYFNIPTWDGQPPADQEAKVVNVREHTRLKFSGPTDTTGTSVTIREFKRLVTGSSNPEMKMSVSVPIGKTTPKGRQRTVALIFPKYFNKQMIIHALATMIAANKPAFCIFQNGTKGVIPYGAGSQLIEGFDHGAWIGATWLDEQNLDNPGGVPLSTGPIFGSGGQDASDNTAA